MLFTVQLVLAIAALTGVLTWLDGRVGPRDDDAAERAATQRRT